MHFSHLYASIHARKMYFTFRQRLLLYYNTFLRLSTELHMKHLPVSVTLPLLLSPSAVRVVRTYVCIFMKNFFNKNSFCFSNLHIVYILRFYYVYLNILFLCIFLSLMYFSIVLL